MTGAGGSVDDKTITEVIEGLRSLIGAIDEERVEATDAQRAYLPGRWTLWSPSRKVRIQADSVRAQPVCS